MSIYYSHNTDITFGDAISQCGMSEIDRLTKDSKTNGCDFAIEKVFIDQEDSTNFLNLPFVHKLKQAGLDPYYALVFVRQGTDNDAQGPHVDAQPEGIFVALNWAMCSHKERMVWYETCGEGFVPPSEPSVVPVHDTLPYLPYDKNHVQEVESVPTIGDKMLLVRTDIPHDIIIEGDGMRISVSLRFHNKWSSWEEAMGFFDGIKI